LSALKLDKSCLKAAFYTPGESPNMRKHIIHYMGGPSWQPMTVE